MSKENLVNAFNILLRDGQAIDEQSMDSIYNSGDSIKNIVEWFKAAKPEPTKKDALIQQGCHLEEVVEHLAAMEVEIEGLEELSYDLKANTKNQSDDSIEDVMKTINELGLLDALCDQIVTAVGVGYMMGFDVEGALKEVIRSNNSKMVDGKFIFDENGKIAKPDTFSEPNLKPYLGVK